MKITKKLLKDAGFACRDLGDEVPYEIWGRDGVELWCFNGKHWLVDALDQGGIGVEFKTMEHLNEFWLACRLPPLTPKEPRTPLVFGPMPPHIESICSGGRR